MNKKGISLPIERLGFWIFVLVTMILILAGLGMYVFPKFSQMIPKLFG